MKTNEELAVIIARQTGENNPQEIIIEQQLKSMDDGSATVVRFDCEGCCYDVPAVVWDDETCFTPRDWQSELPEWDEIEWYDHEHNKDGIVLNGLPRTL